MKPVNKILNVFSILAVLVTLVVYTLYSTENTAYQLEGNQSAELTESTLSTNLQKIEDTWASNFLDAIYPT